MIIKGQKINDRYQIIRMIGEGGMANVYLAHDTILDRNVAVKILRGDLADDEKFVRRFQREAISASALSHPNIVEMYDVGEDDGKYFIVMEYVEGRTLKNLVKRRGALTLPEIIDIMLQLTSGIAHAHDSYIIHRDIKPQNILILDDGTVKITDFGIAMAMNSNELTQTNSVMGSVHYLPPEQANGSGSTIKSDVYSLGILMYELLTGKIPFKGDNAVEIAIKHMKEPLPSVMKNNPDIPQSIENIILTACAKNPKNRYDSVAEMHDDIKCSLDESRSEVKRVVYKYAEQDLDETKILPKIDKNILDNKVEKPKKKDKEGVEKTNLVLIILGSIAAGLILFFTLFIIFYPKLTEKENVRVPDVSGLSVVEAEEILRDNNLTVVVELIYENHSEIDEGLVIRTNPYANRTVKEETEITIIVSTGARGIEVENYVGKNYYEIRAALELQNIHVLVEKKSVDRNDDYDENIIIEQLPNPGTMLVAGDTVTLIIPDIVNEYPDFVSEGWSLEEVEEFAKEYGVVLSVEYIETTAHSPGIILSQSRSAGTPVLNKANLKVGVAVEPIVDLEDILPNDESEEE